MGGNRRPTAASPLPPGLLPRRRGNTCNDVAVAVKQEQENVGPNHNDNDGAAAEFIELSRRQANKANFPPGCPVLVTMTTVHNNNHNTSASGSAIGMMVPQRARILAGTVHQVGRRNDEQEPTGTFLYKIGLGKGVVLVEDHQLQFQVGVPVWVSFSSSNKKKKPIIRPALIVSVKRKNNLSATTAVDDNHNGRSLYSVQLDLPDASSIHHNVAQEKLIYRFLVESIHDATSNTTNDIGGIHPTHGNHDATLGNSAATNSAASASTTTPARQREASAASSIKQDPEPSQLLSAPPQHRHQQQQQQQQHQQQQQPQKARTTVKQEPPPIQPSAVAATCAATVAAARRPVETESRKKKKQRTATHQNNNSSSNTTTNRHGTVASSETKNLPPPRRRTTPPPQNTATAAAAAAAAAVNPQNVRVSNPQRQQQEQVPPPPPLLHPASGGPVVNNNSIVTTPAITTAAPPIRQRPTASERATSKKKRQRTTANLISAITLTSQHRTAATHQNQNPPPPPPRTTTPPQNHAVRNPRNDRAANPQSMETSAVPILPPPPAAVILTEEQRAQNRLAYRRASLRPGHVLNTNPNVFPTIEYWPRHNVQKALEVVRDFVLEFGAKTTNANSNINNKKRNRTAASSSSYVMSPHLRGRCLAWHIQGMCRGGGGGGGRSYQHQNHPCRFQDDHRALTPQEARDMERALEVAMSVTGPIYKRHAIRNLEDQEEYDRRERENEKERLRQEAAAKEETKRQEAAQAQAAAAAKELAAKEEKRKRRQERDPSKRRVFLKMPACYDGNNAFLQGVLDPDAKDIVQLQQQFQCRMLELLPPPPATTTNAGGDDWEICKVELEGDDLEELLECRFEVERIVGQSLPTNLRAKFLMDMERLNRMRNPFLHSADDDDDDAIFLQTRNPNSLSNNATSSASTRSTAGGSNDLCWFTMIPVHKKTSDLSNQTLSMTDARNAADTLGISYPSCHIDIYDRDVDRFQPAMESHVTIWGQQRKDVSHCRDDFFQHVKNSMDDVWG